MSDFDLGSGEKSSELKEDHFIKDFEESRIGVETRPAPSETPLP